MKRPIPRINWNEHNLFADNRFGATSESTPESIATADNAEVPKEPETVNLIPQTGDTEVSEITAEGEKTNE